MRDMFEPIQEANTPDEMRAEFERLAFHDPMVRNVLDMARYKGLSGEDTYVILAYHVMRVLRPMQQDLYKELLMKPFPSMVFPEGIK